MINVKTTDNMLKGADVLKKWSLSSKVLSEKELSTKCNGDKISSKLPFLVLEFHTEGPRLTRFLGLGKNRVT